MKDLMEVMEENPVILGLSKDEDIPVVLEKRGQSCICSIRRPCQDRGHCPYVKRRRETGFCKYRYGGRIRRADVGSEVYQENTEADGIISSKASLVRAAKEEGLYTVHRFLSWMLWLTAISGNSWKSAGRI